MVSKEKLLSSSTEKIAKDVGANHQTGRLIIEMCKHRGIEVVEQYPLVKTWTGPKKKITREELKYFTNYQEKNNQEQRDAALIAWNYAGFPIRIKARGSK
jgi:predicted transcriptional regulator